MSILKTSGDNNQWKNIYLKDIPLNETIVVTKTDATIWEKESGTYKDKQGNPSKFYTTKVNYDGNTDVGILFSVKQKISWDNMAVGDVKITRAVKELDNGKLMNNYVFEGVGGTSSHSPISLSTTKTPLEQEIFDMWKEQGQGDFDKLMATLITYKKQKPEGIGDISESRIKGWL